LPKYFVTTTALSLWFHPDQTVDECSPTGFRCIPQCESSELLKTTILTAWMFDLPDRSRVLDFWLFLEFYTLDSIRRTLAYPLVRCANPLPRLNAGTISFVEVASQIAHARKCDCPSAQWTLELELKRSHNGHLHAS
jgi:hypothetical protein